jgi:hypothetical protein
VRTRSRGGTAGRTTLRTVVVAALVLLGGCVTNPVGPVSSIEAYREKASSSVADAISSVATVRQVGGAELEGSSFTSYSVQVADDSLAGIRTAEDTFETIVPPDAPSEQLRPQVLEALVASRRAVGDVSTALQVGDPDALAAAVAALDPQLAELDELQRSLEPGSA